MTPLNNVKAFRYRLKFQIICLLDKKYDFSSFFWFPNDVQSDILLDKPRLNAYSEPAGCLGAFWTPKPSITTLQDTPKQFVSNFLKCQFQAYNLKNSLLNVIPKAIELYK